MNSSLVDRIADAVLYEGYVLYPYRPSVKNRQRWTFGGLVPRAYGEAHAGSDPWQMCTECLIRGDEHTTLQVLVRFLHLQARLIWELDTPQSNLDDTEDPACRLVESLQVGDRILQTWQEASERQFAPGEWTLGSLAAQPGRGVFAFPASRQRELIRAPLGEVVGLIVREQNSLVAGLEVSVEQAAPGIFRVRVTIENETPLDDAGAKSRDEAMMRALVSTHAVLNVREGEFVSLIDPPDDLRDIAQGCHNVGAWPVLIGNPGDKDTMLAAPIILYDYPQIAAESPGDLFDSTEIDEILTLRIQTLTDEEKRLAAAVDDRVRTLLERTETLAREQLRGLHGTMRGLHVLPDGEPP